MQDGEDEVTKAKEYCLRALGLIDERDNYRARSGVDHVAYRWTWRASREAGLQIERGTEQIDYVAVCLVFPILFQALGTVCLPEALITVHYNSSRRTDGGGRYIGCLRIHMTDTYHINFSYSRFLMSPLRWIQPQEAGINVVAPPATSAKDARSVVQPSHNAETALVTANNARTLLQSTGCRRSSAK